MLAMALLLPGGAASAGGLGGADGSTASDGSREHVQVRQGGWSTTSGWELDLPRTGVPF
eukprot:COSAG02_NODE_41458_length_394_cov_1.071186_1_plen_58_part_01